MPAGWPMMGGWVPALAAGSNPEPVTVTVSPSEARPEVLET